MKRKSCLTLAMILVMAQLISVFAALPATAESPVKTYEVRKSNVAPIVDGTVDAIWDYFESTGNFTFQNGTGSYTKSDSLKATAKILYVENGNLIDVYVLVETDNHSSTWSGQNRSTIVINDAVIHFNWSGSSSIVTKIDPNYNYNGAFNRHGDIPTVR